MEDERKEPIIWLGKAYEFYSYEDLSYGFDVKRRLGCKGTPSELARDTSNFILWWIANIGVRKTKYINNLKDAQWRVHNHEND